MAIVDVEQLRRNTTLMSKVCSDLLDSYTILDAVNLVEFDVDMQSLKNRLSNFSSHSFLENERLVFTHYDVEYFYYDSSIGFTIHNLIKLLRDLDIELGYCMLYTNHYGLTNNLQRYYLHNSITHGLQVFENHYTHSQMNATKYQLPQNNPVYKFNFLSYQARPHRALTRMYLEHSGAVEDTIMAWHPPHSQDWMPGTYLKNKKHKENITSRTEDTSFCYSVPYDRLNERNLNLFSKLYNDYSYVLHDKIVHPKIDSAPDDDNFYAPFLCSSFCSLVCETAFDYPYPYITEKTFKCITHRLPFVLIGAPNSLALLHSLGFKTFDSWWSESYDREADPNTRLKKCFEIIELISSWSTEQCKMQYNSMFEILNYNYNHYYDEYCSQ